MRWVLLQLLAVAPLLRITLKPPRLQWRGNDLKDAAATSVTEMAPGFQLGLVYEQLANEIRTDRAGVGGRSPPAIEANVTIKVCGGTGLQGITLGDSKEFGGGGGCALLY